MKRWKAIGGKTSQIRLIEFDSEDEETAREGRPRLHRQRRLRPRTCQGLTSSVAWPTWDEMAHHAPSHDRGRGTLQCHPPRGVLARM